MQKPWDGKRHDFEAAFWITGAGDRILADQNGRFYVADPSLQTRDGRRAYEVFVVAVPASAAVQAPLPAPRGGRPVEYDWLGAAIHAGARLHAEGLPEEKRGDQAKVARYMADWLSKQDSGEPQSDTYLKKLAKRILLEHRREMVRK